MCRGAKINFWQFVKVSKHGFSKKKCGLFVFVFFYVGKSKKDKMKKMEKGKCQKKKQKNSVFWVVVKKNGFLL